MYDPIWIRESDWKTLRNLSPLALDRFCKRVLDDIAGITTAGDRGAHQRYLEVFELVDRRNEELARAFDDLRRSNALFKLALMRSYGVVTDEEFERFSAETRDSIETILSIGRR